MDKGVGSICLGSKRGGRRMGKEAGIERGGRVSIHLSHFISMLSRSGPS